MAATEIASAYIALYTSMPGVKKEIEEWLGPKNTEEPAEETGKGMGKKLLEGMNSIGKVGAIAVGGAIAAGLGTALVKGFQRLDALDQAEAKLTGLGHSAATVEQIMGNALGSVRGTAFGMGDAATVAASAVAAGIKPGEDLERTLKLVADAATIAGTDMGSMGAIFNKVAASNKVQMDTINQLHDAGVPALALLAEQMGVTAEEASKMASAGEIDFATFQAAMESGMGGAALESGNTFSGAMDNVMASLGRVGEGLLKGIFPDMKSGLLGLIEAMEPLEQVAKDVGAGIKTAFEWIKDNWDWLEPFAIAIGIVTAALVALNVVMLILSINPITLLIAAIIVGVVALIAGIILLVKNWDAVVAWLTEVWEGFVSWFTEVMDGFLSWWGEVWDGFLGFLSDTWNNILAFLQGALDWIVDLFLNWTLLGLIIQYWDEIVAFTLNIWGGIVDWWDGLWAGIGQTFENIWNGIGNFFKDIANGILTGVQNFVNGFIDIINGITGGINAVSAVVGIEAIPSIGRVSLPRLADGGLITARRGGILAQVGEGRYDELVQPTSGPKAMEFKRDIADAVADALGGRPDGPVEFSESSIDRLAEVFAQKLKGYSRNDQRGWAI